MDNLFSKVPNKMYMGEVKLDYDELKKAIAAAKRLLGEGVFKNVKLTGDRKECTQFGNDVVLVATVFTAFANAAENGTPVNDEVN